MQNSLLTIEDMDIANQNEKRLALVLERIDKVKDFKIGDYLIAFIGFDRYATVLGAETRKDPVLNSYGTPVKYRVEHVDKYGIPYVKRLNNKSKTEGRLRPLIQVDSDMYFNGWCDDYIFELDPEYVEAVIIQSEDQYDPSLKHKQNCERRSKIVKHNKNIKLDMSNILHAIKAFDDMKVGETYWNSIKSYMTIQSVRLVEAKGHNSYRKYKNKIQEITVRKSNGKIVTLLPHELVRHNLYKAQPRSFNELKDPI